MMSIIGNVASLNIKVMGSMLIATFASMIADLDGDITVRFCK